MSHHNLKVWPEHFDALLSGDKRSEIRLNDRGFHRGDTLLLQEYNHHTDRYSGRELGAQITHVQTGFGLKSRWVALSLAVST